ncbi:MAG: hypothetical protein R8G33_07355 [Gammaproteobacteria bacterium]|nr:hypothetical protein [Gammaproteobacteria bacterium]
MDDGYLLLEQDDTKSAYYLAMTKSGALYYGSVNTNMDLNSEWKLIVMDETTIDSVH